MNDQAKQPGFPRRGFVKGALTGMIFVGMFDQIAISSAEADPADVGQWTDPLLAQQDAVVGIHAALLHTGKVIFFWHREDYYANVETGGVEQEACLILDPVSMAYEVITVRRNPFCAGHAFLPDGRLLIAGGHYCDKEVCSTPKYNGITALQTYDPINATWKDVGDISGPRWYPTCTTLQDGRIFIVSGAANVPVAGRPIQNIKNPTYEITDGAFTLYNFNHSQGDSLLTANRADYFALGVPASGWNLTEKVGRVYMNINDAPGLVPLYRLYSSVEGAHYYTTIAADQQAAIASGYADEGIACYVFNGAGPNRKPLWRAFNTQNNDYFYTSKEDQYYALPPSWRRDGVIAYVLSSMVPLCRVSRRSTNQVPSGGTLLTVDTTEYITLTETPDSPQTPGYWSAHGVIGTIWDNPYGEAGLVPLYRLSKGDDFIYTADLNDRNILVSNFGYTYQFVVGYVYAQPGSGRSPLYRAYNAALGQHLFTTDATEYNSFAPVNQGSPWNQEGIVAYVKTGKLFNFLSDTAVGSYYTYPFVTIIPSGQYKGKLFMHVNRQTRIFDPAIGDLIDNAELNSISNSPRTFPGQGAYVLLPLDPAQGYRGEVLVIGGAGTANGNAVVPANATCEMLDLNTFSSGWQSRQPMSAGRVLCDAVLLPDGTVLVVNGAAESNPLEAGSGNVPAKVAKLYNPNTNQWITLSTAMHARLYHSTALLLPDGRVLVAGHDDANSTPPYAINNYTVEIFSPPYLFKSGIRPNFSSPLAGTSTEVTYGGTFNVSVQLNSGRTISTLCLICLGSVTHSNNMSQRHIKLEYSMNVTGGLIATAPPDRDVAPPGYYMMFVVDSLGVPSISRSVHLS